MPQDLDDLENNESQNPSLRANYWSHRIFIKECRLRACLCFLKQIDSSCPKSQNCLLAKLRRDIEQNSPALCAFMADRINAQGIVDDWMRVEVLGEGEIWQKVAARKSLQELTAFTHVLFFYLLALDFLGIAPNHITKDRLLAEERNGLSWVELDQCFKQLKITIRGFPQFTQALYPKLLLTILSVYIATWADENGIFLEPWSEAGKDLFFKSIQQHLAAKR